VPNRKLTLEEVREYCVRANKNLGEWDYDLLADFDLEKLKDIGFSSDELDKIMNFSPDDKDDEVPEVTEEPKSKLGDIYQLGNHRIMCGDSTKVEDIEKLMDGKKADMVFTDPPYGMNLDTNFGDGMGQSGIFKSNKNYLKVIGDNEDFSDNLIKCIFDNFGYCNEILIWGVDYFAELIPERKKGSWFVWDKKEQGKDFDFTLSEFELCWSKNKHSRKIIRVAWRGLIGLGTQDTKKRIHPNQKPLELMEKIIKRSDKDKKCNIMVDPFLGSGSTLIACEKTNRILFGCEIDNKYIDVIIKRWMEYTKKTAYKIEDAESGRLKEPVPFVV